MGLNIMAPLFALEPCFLDPAQAKYAIFDFGGSLAFPCDISIDDVVDDRDEFKHDDHPFKGDVRMLGNNFLDWLTVCCSFAQTTF